jgi:hypothetical protein
MFNKLQYISQGNTVEEQTRNIHQALDGGCKWIQRFKIILTHFFCFGEKQKFYAKISEFSSTIMSISPTNCSRWRALWIN